MDDKNQQKRIWAANPESNDQKAKALMVCTIIIMGIAALLVCIFGIIPALLSDVADIIG